MNLHEPVLLHRHPYDIRPVPVDPFTISQIPVGFHTDIVSARLQLRCHGAYRVRGTDPHLKIIFRKTVPAVCVADGIPSGPFRFSVQPDFYVAVGYSCGLNDSGFRLRGAPLGGRYFAEHIISIGVCHPGADGEEIFGAGLQSGLRPGGGVSVPDDIAGHGSLMLGTVPDGIALGFLHCIPGQSHGGSGAAGDR